MTTTTTKKKSTRKRKARAKRPTSSCTPARVKYDAAERLHRMFARLIKVLPTVAEQPFNDLKAAVKELQAVDSDQNRKMFALYAARNVKKGLRSFYRDLQQTAAHARTRLDILINKAVAAHSRLLRDETRVATRSLPLPTVRDLLTDIDALERDFPAWQCTQREFIVRTKPVVLETEDGDVVALNAFEIRLNLAVRSFEDLLFTVVPLDPVYCSGYPHPHISGNVMCTGEAYHPIMHSMKNGLAYEFFTIVNNTLMTYNPESPYVALEEWIYERTDCAICGEEIYTDNGGYDICTLCGDTVCDECHMRCENGAVAVCRSCVDAGHSSGCCSSIGSAGCVLRENKPCITCGEVFGDDECMVCPLTGIVLCHNCIDNMRDDNEPCRRTMVDKYTYRQSTIDRMGDRKDEICKFVCVGNDNEGRRCLLRGGGVYSYKEPNEGTESTLEQDHGK